MEKTGSAKKRKIDKKMILSENVSKRTKGWIGISFIRIL
ncbi:hypothetical protein LEP1GSC193_2472 [Leptospira alstonii serovar Pingchang str. 80-412]|uniref:Uncharacterized protein n=2 Tax=Leptospira alstonii TaxID=28452 RepID=M6D5T0_9LEPT|nr:hypothetical protein LEP1GSC194_2511 [Leptospira alstonii serovar Sichuan str. 79601]EQA81039.1 hypothetical protein LEP1GSC193_2472 [Leptospira alstonii serovar Pingchang str. 80-412]